jgi:hypothetical protein
MGFATYDPKQVHVIIGGAPIGGFVDGTFIDVNFDEEQFKKVVGADGLVSRAKTNNHSGQIAITLQATSSSNDVLSLIWNADRRASAGVVPVLVKDSSGRTLFAAAHAWIQKHPDASFSKDIGERKWVFDCDELEVFAGGNA